MLDQKSTETYKSIALPRDLRADILQKHAEQANRKSVFTAKAFLRPVSAVCAMVLLVAVLVTVLLPADIGVYTGVYTREGKIDSTPQSVSTETVSFTGGIMRASLDPDPSGNEVQTATSCIPLYFDYGDGIYLTVHEGSLLLPDGSASFVFAGQSGEVPDRAPAYWVLDECKTDEPLTASITDGSGKLLGTITLTLNATDNTRYIAVHPSES